MGKVPVGNRARRKIVFDQATIRSLVWRRPASRFVLVEWPRQCGIWAKCPCTKLATKNAIAIAAMIQAVRRAPFWRRASAS
ncbi:MAG TPA: hypothetical protein VJ862_05180 [Rhodanobacteraceae bacterium]|nr:hypothetical protein [Rhodanobacteraceae bacterium]